MKILEDVHHRLNLELPRCKSHREVENLLLEARTSLLESKAPLGQKQRMWEDIKGKLPNLVSRPDIALGAQAIIDRILKNIL